MMPRPSLKYQDCAVYENKDYEGEDRESTTLSQFIRMISIITPVLKDMRMSRPHIFVTGY